MTARPDFMDTARQAFAWIGSAAVPADGGLAWRDLRRPADPSRCLDVAARARTGPEGLTWSSTEHTASPLELPPEPGLMQGTAGIASWLIRHHALSTRPNVPSRPVEPGPWF